MNQYAISVIVPIYNQRRFLPRAMQSLEEQTIGFERLQVILVDDCSTDGSDQIIQEYTERYANVFAYRTQQNTGAAGEPRNIGLEHAQAPYIMFLDPDDWYIVNACEFLYEKMEEEQADIVGGTYRILSGEEDTGELEFSPEMKTAFLLPEQLLNALVNRFPLWTKIYKREFIENNRIRFMREGYGQDTVFLCECLSKAEKYTLYSVCVYNYYDNAGSVTNKQGEVFFERNLNCMKQCAAVLAPYQQIAEWMQGNLSTYYIEKCIEFNQLGEEELARVLEKYRELFIHQWECTEENVAAALVRDNHIELAVSYIVNLRASKRAIEDERKRIQMQEHQLLELEQERSSLEERCSELQKQNESIESSLRESEKEKAILAEHCDELQKQNESIESSLQESEKEKTILAEHCDELQKQNELIKCSLRVSEKVKKALTDRCGELQTQNELLGCGMQATVRVKNALEERCDELNRQIEQMAQELQRANQEKTALAVRYEELEKHNEQIACELRVPDQSQKELEERCEAIQRWNNQVEHELRIAQSNLKHIYDSDMYKLSLKYYKIRDALLPDGSRIRNIFKKYFIRSKERHESPAPIRNQIDQFHAYGKFKRMDIITTQHTMFIAKLIAQQMDRLNIQCEIHTGELEEYLDIPYVIICPQFIQKYPKVYIAFQMEQTISSRWFTKDYFVKLQNSCAIFDYSLENVEFFHRPENQDVRSRVYYLPIDYYKGYKPLSCNAHKEYDVLFYGDANSCERRQKALSELNKHFRVKVCSDVFGEELYEEIKRAKVVVNIHYYEGALLETTRLYETLSLNTCVVVSERSNDRNEEERLESVVDFVDVGDTNGMIERIQYWLTNEKEWKKKVKENKRILERRPNAFSFFFKRFLLAYDRVTFDEFYATEKDFVTLETNRLCLSLPESTARRRSFDQDNRYGFQCIPGLRHEKGWVGCGLSYKFIFKKALECGMNNVMICEDDVIFPVGFEEKLEQIAKELEERGDWSVFSGVMADVGRVKVSDCVKDDNGYLIKIDHMVSTVFNMYNRDMFKLFGVWDEQNRDVQKNAIDRYLESKNLGVYVKLPFLVGHKEELNSTIWGFSNVEYSALIEHCQQKLLELARNYLDGKP